VSRTEPGRHGLYRRRHEHQIREFRIAIPDDAIDDLHRRLARTRLPVLPDAGWERGAPVAVIDELASYWAHEFDWRAVESQLNQYPHFVTDIDHQTIHFLHLRSPEPDATPLLLLHGWPGTFLESIDAIGPMSDPRHHGGDPADAFHVVVPSLPGFGFSTPLASLGWGTQRMAAAFLELMDRLGYSRFGVQGGDVGALVGPAIAAQAPDRLIGVHVNALLTYPIGADGEMHGLTEEEQTRWARMQAFNDGYLQIQSKSPHTLAYALNDSPVGLLAWIAEKYAAWTDSSDGRPGSAIGRDRLLANISIYWFTGSAGSAAQYYLEMMNESTWHAEETPAGSHDADDDTSAWPSHNDRTPVGVLVSKRHDIAIRRWAEREHHIVHWTEHEQGGHFFAAEQPALYTTDIQQFFRPLR
jgi:pimeloyl-ACP methyl ester carboxylesterase